MHMFPSFYIMAHRTILKLFGSTG